MMAQEDTIVKSIIRNQGKPPFLILYNKEQILFLYMITVDSNHIPSFSTKSEPNWGTLTLQS